MRASSFGSCTEWGFFSESESESLANFLGVKDSEHKSFWVLMELNLFELSDGFPGLLCFVPVWFTDPDADDLGRLLGVFRISSNSSSMTKSCSPFLISIGLGARDFVLGFEWGLTGPSVSRNSISSSRTLASKSMPIAAAIESIWEKPCLE